MLQTKQSPIIGDLKLLAGFAEQIASLKPISKEAKLIARNKMRKAKQKQKKIDSKQAVINHKLAVDQWYTVEVLTAICPYNVRGNTSFLIAAGTKCKAKKMKTGFKLHLIKGKPALNIQDMEKRYLKYIARESEIKVLSNVIRF